MDEKILQAIDNFPIFPNMENFEEYLKTDSEDKSQYFNAVNKINETLGRIKSDKTQRLTAYLGDERYKKFQYSISIIYNNLHSKVKTSKISKTSEFYKCGSNISKLFVNHSIKVPSIYYLNLKNGIPFNEEKKNKSATVLPKLATGVPGGEDSIERFIIAQNNGDGHGSNYSTALEEMMPKEDGSTGKKGEFSHWIWYCFPQFLGNGSSDLAKKYAIKSPQEAVEYFSDSILKERYISLSVAVNLALVDNIKTSNKDKLLDVMGKQIDVYKLHESVSLFYLVSKYLDDNNSASTLESILKYYVDDKNSVKHENNVHVDVLNQFTMKTSQPRSPQFEGQVARSPAVPPPGLESRPDNIGIGLNNGGNQCYMNAVIQAFTSIPSIQGKIRGMGQLDMNTMLSHLNEIIIRKKQPGIAFINRGMGAAFTSTYEKLTPMERIKKTIIEANNKAFRDGVDGRKQLYLEKLKAKLINEHIDKLKVIALTYDDIRIITEINDIDVSGLIRIIIEQVSKESFGEFSQEILLPFIYHEQQDAYEFISSFLIPYLEYVEFFIMDNAIQFVKKSCLNCPEYYVYGYKRGQATFEIPSFLINSNNTVADCFTDYFNDEVVDDFNCGDYPHHEDPPAPRCVNTKGLSLSEKKIITFPEVLIISLKRFKYNTATQTSEKITKNLTLSSNININGLIYNLQAVVYHQGSTINSGHYIAECLVDGQWINYDDDIVTPAVGEPVDNRNRQSYILFYTRQTPVEDTMFVEKLFVKRALDVATQAEILKESTAEAAEAAEAALELAPDVEHMVDEPFKKGDLIQITQGKFAGKTGSVVSVDEDFDDTFNVNLNGVPEILMVQKEYIEKLSPTVPIDLQPADLPTASGPEFQPAAELEQVPAAVAQHPEAVASGEVSEQPTKAIFFDWDDTLAIQLRGGELEAANTPETKAILKGYDALIPIEGSSNIFTTENIINLLGELTKNNVPWYILSCGGNRNDYQNLIKMANGYGININASGEIWMGYEGENQELYRVDGVNGGMICDQNPTDANDKIKGLTKLMEFNPFLATVDKCLVDDQEDNITALNAYLGKSIRPGKDETDKIIAAHPYRISATFFVYYGSEEHYLAKNILNNHTKKIDQIYGWCELEAQSSPHLPPEHSPPAGPQEEKIALFFDFDETLICKANVMSDLPTGYIHVGNIAGWNIITSQAIIDLLVLCTSNDNIDWYIVSKGGNLNVLELLIQTYADKNIIIMPNGRYFSGKEGVMAINTPQDKANIIDGIMKKERYSLGLFVDDKLEMCNAVEKVNNIKSPAVHASKDWTLEDTAGKRSIINFTIPGDNWDHNNITVGIHLLSNNTILRDIMPVISEYLGEAGPSAPLAGAQAAYRPPGAAAAPASTDKLPYKKHYNVEKLQGTINALREQLKTNASHLTPGAVHIINNDIALLEKQIIVKQAEGQAAAAPAMSDGIFQATLLFKKRGFMGTSWKGINEKCNVEIHSNLFKLDTLNDVNIKDDNHKTHYSYKSYNVKKLSKPDKDKEGIFGNNYRVQIEFRGNSTNHTIVLGFDSNPDIVRFINELSTSSGYTGSKPVYRGGNKRRSKRKINKRRSKRKNNKRSSRKKNTTKRRISRRKNTTKKRYSRKK
uniref:USP domain-containing protein n=1 Tax=viral metagenome TaxID=1070528 RepID=A0A6C0CFW1_9ZZZZ